MRLATEAMEGIPPFLLRTPEAQERINAVWARTAYTNPFATGPRHDTEAERFKAEADAYAAAEAERKRVAANAKTASRRADEKLLAAKRDGMVWVTSFSMWVPMCKEKLGRIVSEVDTIDSWTTERGKPSPGYRAAFIKLLGPSLGESVPAPGRHARSEPTARRTSARPAATGAAPVAAKRGSKPRRSTIPLPREDAAAPTARAAIGKRSKEENHAAVIALLSRPEGTTLAEISAATGWLTHSASAYLSGIRKPRDKSVAPRAIGSAVEPRGRVYRLEATQ